MSSMMRDAGAVLALYLPFVGEVGLFGSTCAFVVLLLIGKGIDATWGDRRGPMREWMDRRVECRTCPECGQMTYDGKRGRCKRPTCSLHRNRGGSE